MQYMNKRIKKILIVLLCLVLVIGIGVIRYIHYQNSAIVICIDAGHGGYDTGAIAADGTYEKSLTLAYAKQIGTYLEASDENIRVVYTRTSDTVSWPSNVSKDLKACVQYAKDEEADYYLSIHFNSADASAYGYTAYVKSDDKASKAIYKTMAQNLSKSGWEYDRGIETTTNYPLYVVDNLSIPSMLVEVGFITNKNELQDLEQSTYRKTICKAIANAYISYIQKQSDD